MSLATQILALATRIAAELKARVPPGAILADWSPSVSYRLSQNVIYSGKIWRLGNMEGSLTFSPPPGLPSSVYKYSVGTSNTTFTAAGTVNSDAIHGACFILPAGYNANPTAIIKVGTNLVSATPSDDTVKVWVRRVSDPAPLETDPPDGSQLILAGDLSVRVMLNTSWLVPTGVPMVVWFGPTGGVAANLIRTSATISYLDSPNGGDGTDFTTPAVEYMIRPRGGVKTDQVRFIPILLYFPGTIITNWRETLTPPPSAVVALLHAETLNGTAVSLDPSTYRRLDFTTGTAATTISLQNPASPVAGSVLPSPTILIKTPAGTTPGVITWINLTGGSSIPLPAASQVVAAELEWVDTTVGWLVVGIRA